MLVVRPVSPGCGISVTQVRGPSPDRCFSPFHSPPSWLLHQCSPLKQRHLFVLPLRVPLASVARILNSLRHTLLQLQSLRKLQHPSHGQSCPNALFWKPPSLPRSQWLLRTSEANPVLQSENLTTCSVLWLVFAPACSGKTFLEIASRTPMAPCIC